VYYEYKLTLLGRTHCIRSTLLHTVFIAMSITASPTTLSRRCSSFDPCKQSAYIVNTAVYHGPQVCGSNLG